MREFEPLRCKRTMGTIHVVECTCEGSPPLRLQVNNGDNPLSGTCLPLLSFSRLSLLWLPAAFASEQWGQSTRWILSTLAFTPRAILALRDEPVIWTPRVRVVRCILWRAVSPTSSNVQLWVDLHEQCLPYGYGKTWISSIRPPIPLCNWGFHSSLCSTPADARDATV